MKRSEETRLGGFFPNESKNTKQSAFSTTFGSCQSCRFATVFYCCRHRLSLQVCNCLLMLLLTDQVCISACICSFFSNPLA
ncbi:hypothetical protein [Methanimicrococcus hongohii]|uniref:hypothetical protein n=1 Tax=Methanimicrococcus hongohii TaxID=3028295 RepID=UPI0029309166|nr:hypothetical protein [Methanimicrococcus sp. Hf6]